MKSFFEVSINIIEMFTVIFFLTHYLGAKYSGVKRTLGFLIGWLTAFCTVSIINRYIVFESFATYIYVGVYFLYALLFLKGTALLKLWMSVITQAIITMIAVFTILAASVLLNCPLSHIMSDFTVVRVCAVIFTKVLFALVCFIIANRTKKNSFERNSMWYKLILIPLISVISITKLMEVVIENPSSDKYALLAMSALIASNIMVYYFYTVLSEQYQSDLKIRLLEQQGENMTQYISNSDSFVKEMRMVKHDIKNHLLSIDNYLSENKVDSAREYIKTLTGEYLPESQKYINTGNEAFDILLNAKMSFFKQHNIHLDVSVEENSICCLNGIDTGIIFGNLLDNALEAVADVKQKYVSIDIGFKAEYLNILVKNTIESSVLQKNNELTISKDNKDLHGIGIASVKNVIKKHDGMIDFFEENNLFCCQISLHKNSIKQM